MIERERRFLVDDEPSDLPTPSRIVQGYLTTEPVAVRVRRRDGDHTLTVKAGAGLARVEVERSLDADEFDALWTVADALRIEKRRYRIPLGDDPSSGPVAELDLFDGELAGRRIVEVEFDDDESAAAFVPPDWFGREVTDDGRFTNAALARDGWPA
jgi:CYTH domain-containing protein